MEWARQREREGDVAEQWQCIELVVMYFFLASENVEKLMAQPKIYGPCDSRVCLQCWGWYRMPLDDANVAGSNYKESGKRRHKVFAYGKEQ